jgi:hypothetical protein
MTPDDKLYGFDDQEQLDNSVEEVIEQLVDNACVKVGEPFGVIAARITWPIQVHVFRRVDVKKCAGRIAERALEDALETLDDEHGDEGCNPTTPTERMKEAAAEFGKAVTEDYVSWACEPTGEVIEFTLEQARELFDEEGK